MISDEDFDRALEIFDAFRDTATDIAHLEACMSVLKEALADLEAGRREDAYALLLAGIPKSGAA